MQKFCDCKTVQASEKCYAVFRSEEVKSWRLGEKQAKFRCLFCRIVYLILGIFPLLLSAKVWRAIKAHKAGRHYQALENSVQCSWELSAQAQIWVWRHEMVARVSCSFMTAACLPQTRVQLSIVQGMVLDCMACGSQGDLHYNIWNGQSGLHRHEEVECNAQYGSGSPNSHRFSCSIPTHLLPSWELKMNKKNHNFYLFSKQLPGLAALSIHYFCDETTQ